jgi:hypothetical protein
MNLKNAQILLTINLEGGHKPRFVKGMKKGVEKDIRVFDPELNRGSDCHQIIHLSEQFVNHAISLAGRVSARMTFAYNNWKKMTTIERLECNLAELSIALGGHTFVYEVIPDESE